MKVFVTGASGFVGSHVARYLKHAGHEVVGTYRQITPFLKSLKGDVECWKMDVARITPFQLINFDAVVHCAGTHHVSGATQEDILRDNILATLALIDASKTWKVNAFIFMSTLSVYGKIDSDIVNENCPVVQPTVYGMTKMCCERVLSEQPFPSVSLRMPIILGPGAHERNMVPRLARMMVEHRVIDAFNLDKFFNAIIHIADLNKFIEKLLAEPKEGHVVLNLAAKDPMNFRNMLVQLGNKLGVAPKIHNAHDSSPAFIISTKRAESLGYNPMSVSDMIDQYALDFLQKDAGDRA